MGRISSPAHLMPGAMRPRRPRSSWYPRPTSWPAPTPTPTPKPAPEREPLAVRAVGQARSAHSRRSVVLLAAAAAVVVVIGGVWIAFPGLTASLAQNFEKPSTGTTQGVSLPGVTPAGHHGHRSKAKSGQP